MKRLLVWTVAPALILGLGGAAAAHPSAHPPGHRHGHPWSIALSVLGTHHSDVFDASAAEIVAHDPTTQHLFVVNAAAGEVDVLDIADPTGPRRVSTLRTAEAVGDPEAVANSVAVRRDGVVAVAVEAGTKTDPGWVVFYDRRGALRNVLEVGALPDMLTFTPDSKTLLVANEGEPDDEYTVDPEGTVSVVDVRAPIPSLADRHVRTAGFRAWDRGERELHPDIRVFGPHEDEPSRNLEPEYIVADPDSRTAYVVLQEANAIAELDVRKARFTDVWPLGFKDHLLPGNELDVSDRDDEIRIGGWPVYGMYQPDGFDAYRWRGQTLLVTANEGDGRDWDAYSEESRLRALTEQTPLCEDSPRLREFLAGNEHGITTVAELRENENLGRLSVTTANGLRADGSCYEDVYAFGGRSFSIWTTSGQLLFDSGSELERVTAQAYPDFFNSNNDVHNLESRSDNKGPEPEAVAIGKVAGRTYAFIGLERIGGVVVYDITHPRAPSFVQYLNHRDFTADPQTRQAGDLGAEDLLFVAAKDSPIGAPVLVVANEVSGTTTLMRVDRVRGQR